MLVLTRKIDESIRIGEDIVITIVHVERDQVKIGISAPREIAIHRQEIFEEIRAANEAAAIMDPPTLPPLSFGGTQDSAPSAESE